MATAKGAYKTPEARALAWTSRRWRSRSPAAWTSVAFVITGVIYYFWWGQHVDWGSPVHTNWNTTGDIWSTFYVAGQIAHGHLSQVYYRYHFATFPGIAFVLAPLAALASALNLSVDVLPSQVLPRPEAWELLGPFVLVLSTLPLFAFDALAERLGASSLRRVLLAAAEAIALLNVSVFWGHPEDALAIGLMTYAYLLSFEGKWHNAAWLFGAAVAFQPLVLAAFPVLLASAGVKRWSGLVGRAVVPGLIVLAGPLIANFHLTFTALTQQPNYPTAPANHQTPWTALAPRLHIGVFAVAAGPGRLVSLALACAVGWWSLRWRDRLEMLVWAAALSLALRCFTESVMDPYYLWPALAVAMLASVRNYSWRFAATVVAAIFVTSTSQWHLGWLLWWSLNTVALVVVLLFAIPLRAAQISSSTVTRTLAKTRSGPQRPSQRSSATKRKTRSR